MTTDRAIPAGMSTIDGLPDLAPSRSVRPGEKPNPTAARALLAGEGVDATNLDDLMRYAGERGWIWRLGGGRNYPRCWAATVAPWVSQDAWADVWGDGPAEALSIALVLTTRTPPPEFIDEGPGEIEA